MSVTTRSLTRAFAAIVGGDAVRDDGQALEAAAIDGVEPRLVVAPATVPELAQVLALAHDEQLALAPRGSGSALALGCPPERVDVVADLQRLSSLVEVNPDDLTLTAQAGATAGALANTLAAHRQWLPLDPPGWFMRTLGGLAATGASGPLRARYGTLRDLVLGVRFVQADGVVTWGGAKVVKSVTGYDIPKLMVGSLGTLGVLAELTLRVHPKPEREATWLVTFDAVEAAVAYVERVVDSTAEPSRVELLNTAALRACGVETAPAAVAISVGSVAEAVDAQGEMLTAFAESAHGHIGSAPAGFWTTYDQVNARRHGLRLLVATLPSRLAATVRELERAAPAVGGEGLVTGNATLGVLALGLGRGDPQTLAVLVERTREFIARDGGSVVIEHGPRELRKQVDPWGPIEPAAFAIMRGLKETFDPRRILNPGRFVGGL